MQRTIKEMFSLTHKGICFPIQNNERVDKFSKDAKGTFLQEQVSLEMTLEESAVCNFTTVSVTQKILW